ncbi:YAF9-like protein [Thozetella sp. PMI_491]|nr:YAF9-like protein [Thozetella sp. PMI_491]
MAPPSSAGKRVKGVQIFRPFVYGTTARLFDEKTNPKPPGVPDDHTHSWTVFVKGIDDTDTTYWLRRVQFKLHESIPNHVRMVEGEKGKPFQIHETGWGEFEIAIKLYYVPESNEKPQTIYHHLRLHPFGRSEEEREAMRASGKDVVSWTYEEQLFNEPYDPFYEILTSGALPPPKGSAGGKSGGKGKEKTFVAPGKSDGGVLERSALIPMTNRPAMPFSHETEQLEIKKLKDALVKVEEMSNKLKEETKAREEYLQSLKAEAAAAPAS